MDVMATHQLKVREGLTVWRRSDGTVVKQAPRLFEVERREAGLHRLVLEDLGDGELPHDPGLFMANAHILLMTLDDHQIWHGDLTIKNIIVRGNMPYAIDFGEAKWYHETDRQPKRPESDSHHLWQAVEAILEPIFKGGNP
jgi:tRNA A-37 threonylcarbamoyl transferase component Bud32